MVMRSLGVVGGGNKAVIGRITVLQTVDHSKVHAPAGWGRGRWVAGGGGLAFHDPNHGLQAPLGPVLFGVSSARNGLGAIAETGWKTPFLEGGIKGPLMNRVKGVQGLVPVVHVEGVQGVFGGRGPREAIGQPGPIGKRHF